MPPFGWALAILGAIGAVLGIAWYIEHRLTTRRERAAAKQLSQDVAEVREEVRGLRQYLDGLPRAATPVRDPFLEGQKLEKQNRYRDAIAQYQAAFQTETTDSQWVALHILIGNCFFNLSELEEAAGHYQQADKAAREADDQQGLAASLGNMGNVYLEKGEQEKALKHYEQALAIFEQIGAQLQIDTVRRNIERTKGAMQEDAGGNDTV